MIRGIGTDIVEVARIAQALARTGPRFAERILAPCEWDAYAKAANPERFLAKRFAIKEAAAKALGTGIARGVSWHHIYVDHDAAGAPQLRFSGGAEVRQRELQVQGLHVSVSDEQAYVIAFVILEGALSER